MRLATYAGRSGALRDSDIRHPLEEWLLARHAGESDTRILHELHIPRPAARVDLAVVNGRLAGFEIKSDVDSLSRLGRQSYSFSQIFEQMTLVATQRHVHAAKSKIPDWWGLIESDGLTFRIRRRPRVNPTIDIEKLLHILLRDELLQVEARLTQKPGPRSHRKGALISRLIENHKPKAVLRAARDVLKVR